MWRDDLDTAFRHLDLYDRFGCPGGHVQATFRCLTRFGGQIDPKVAETLSSRIHACWINPGAQPQAAAAATPGRAHRPPAMRRRARRLALAGPQRHPGGAGEIVRRPNVRPGRTIGIIQRLFKSAPLKRHGVIPVVNSCGRIILNLPPCRSNLGDGFAFLQYRPRMV